MLGPAEEVYGPNKITFTVVALIALLFLLPSLESGGNLADNWLWIAVVLAPFGLLLAWLGSAHVSLHADGISYRSLFGQREMRWEDVERLYYSAVKRSVNFIPVGTYYWFKLVDARTKISFGNRIARPSELGNKLIERSYPHLFRKTASQFDAGAEVDFGAIRLSRQDGIKIKKLFGYRQVPLDQVASYAIDAGHFYIWRIGEKRTTGPGLREVPNAFVLLGLFDAIYHPEKT